MQKKSLFFYGFMLLSIPTFTLLLSDLNANTLNSLGVHAHRTYNQRTLQVNANLLTQSNEEHNQSTEAELPYLRNIHKIDPPPLDPTPTEPDPLEPIPIDPTPIYPPEPVDPYPEPPYPPEPIQPGTPSEVQLVVTRGDDPAPNGCQNNDCSFREAVLEANAGSDDYVITFSDSIIDLNLERSSLTGDTPQKGDIDIKCGDRKLAINGPVDTGITITWIVPDLDKTRLLHIHSGEVVVENLRVYGGYSNTTEDSLDGSGILNQAQKLTLRNVEFLFNTGYKGGGGLYNHDGIVTLDNVVFVANGAKQGGAIYNNSGTMKIKNTTFESDIELNRAYDGGSIYNNTGTITIDDSVITESVASDYASAIYNNSGDIVADNLEVTHNNCWDTATIYNDEGEMQIANSRISENEVSNAYGAIANINGIVEVNNSTINKNKASEVPSIYNANEFVINTTKITHNQASGLNGGIVNKGDMSITDSKVADNIGSMSYAGGINSFGGTLNLEKTDVVDNSGYGITAEGEVRILNATIMRHSKKGIQFGDGIMTIQNTQITHNSINSLNGASDTVGGGIAIGTNGEAEISNTTISGHHAVRGGGIYNEGKLTLEESSIIDNKSDYAGGGIYNLGDIAIKTSTIANNQDLYHGGGITIENGVGSIFNSTISSNESNWSGGGIYVKNGSLNVESSTIAENVLLSGSGRGGGIFEENSTVNMQNSIVASSQGICSDCYGAIYSYGYNLIEDKSNCNISGNTASDIYGEDPLLGVLADNGGPTLTHALLQNSPALFVGSCQRINGMKLSYDQRGIERPQGPWAPIHGCDRGSYERIVGVANLYVDIKYPPTTVTLGEQYKYQFEIENLGPDPATQVELVLELDENLIVNSVPNYCTVSSTANNINCEVGDIAVNELVDIEISFTPDGGRHIYNFYELTLNEDSNPATWPAGSLPIMKVEESDSRNTIPNKYFGQRFNKKDYVPIEREDGEMWRLCE